MSANLKIEAEAYKSLGEWLARAPELVALFERAGATVPDVLLRISRPNGHSPASQRASIAPFKPPAPNEAQPDWVWVDLESATPWTLALAIVRQSPELLTVREIHEKVQAISESVSLGTIANVGTRTEKNGLIVRDENGKWGLTDPNRAALIHDGYVWGPPQIFQNPELAAHRRAAILHVLRQNPIGLQQAQIMAQIRQQDLVRFPISINKALVKADLEALEENGKIRRISNSRKWEVVQ